MTERFVSVVRGLFDGNPQNQALLEAMNANQSDGAIENVQAGTIAAPSLRTPVTSTTSGTTSLSTAASLEALFSAEVAPDPTSVPLPPSFGSSVGANVRGPGLTTKTAPTAAGSMVGALEEILRTVSLVPGSAGAGLEERNPEVVEAANMLQMAIANVQVRAKALQLAQAKHQQQQRRRQQQHQQQRQQQIQESQAQPYWQHLKNHQQHPEEELAQHLMQQQQQQQQQQQTQQQLLPQLLSDPRAMKAFQSAVQEQQARSAAKAAAVAAAQAVAKLTESCTVAHGPHEVQQSPTLQHQPHRLLSDDMAAVGVQAPDIAAGISAGGRADGGVNIALNVALAAADREDSATGHEKKVIIRQLLDNLVRQEAVGQLLQAHGDIKEEAPADEQPSSTGHLPSPTSAQAQVVPPQHNQQLLAAHYAAAVAAAASGGHGDGGPAVALGPAAAPQPSPGNASVLAAQTRAQMAASAAAGTWTMRAQLASAAIAAMECLPEDRPLTSAASAYQPVAKGNSSRGNAKDSASDFRKGGRGGSASGPVKPGLQSGGQGCPVTCGSATAATAAAFVTEGKSVGNGLWPEAFTFATSPSSEVVLAGDGPQHNDICSIEAPITPYGCKLGEESDTLRAHLQQLQTKDPERVFIVRKINRLGFDSPAILRELFERQGPVEDVLVAHSHVKCPNRNSAARLRPSGLGFVVMVHAEDARAILAQGELHFVENAVIRLSPFKKRLALAELSDFAIGA